MLRSCLCAALFVSAYATWASAQDGPQLLFVTGRSGNPEIMLQKPDVDPAGLGVHDASDIFPYWSRNGKAIAFSSNRTGRFQIYSMDPAGAGLAQLSLERYGDSLSPSWSPTGDHLVYQHGREHIWELVVITADGSEWRPIVKNAWQPDWSPPLEKGDRIAFVGAEHDAGLFIYTCEPSGTGIRRIHRLGNRIGLVNPIWSPDGKQLAFTDRASKSHEIFVMGPDGQNVRALTTLGARNVYPTWSADSKRVYFYHEGADHLWQMMSVDVETRTVETLDTIPAERLILGARASWY